MEEIKFKNTSKMNAEEIAVFQSYAMKKTKLIMSIFFMLIFVGLGVGLAFWNITVGIICIVCGVVGGIFFLPYLLKENQKRTLTQNLGDKKYLNTFEFYENHFFVTSNATQSANDNDYQEVGTQTVDYADLYKVVTYKDRLFIFLNPQQSFIVNFNGMTTGTVAELLEFFKGKGVNVVDKSSLDITPKKK